MKRTLTEEQREAKKRYMKAYRLANRDKLAMQEKAYKEANKEKYIEWRKSKVNDCGRE